jgi:hypothetical protein
MAVDAASFKTEILSITFGSISFRLTPSTPSAIIKGLLLPVKDPIPLMIIPPPSTPGCPLPC